MNQTEMTIPFDWQPPSATLTKAELSRFRLPNVPLKMLPQHGVFLWWPADPNLWAHPDDTETIRRFVPGSRIFRRSVSPDYSDRELGFVVYQYGEVCFRAKPILWRQVVPDAFRPSDFVELKSRSGKTRPRIAKIAEVLWNRHTRTIEYVVAVRNMQVARRFQAEDLRPAIPLGAHVPLHHIDMARGENLR